ncbi:MAG: adenosylmethionine decarboxylase [Candidatus Saganbacteria bacterium]|nr:adenosylmethionine decarboxylase [Candidatus Saganbacteria bacterium]
MVADNKYGFGPHLLLDLYDCPGDKLADVGFIFDLLDTFPARIGTTKISQPYVFRYKGKNEKEWGVSGVVLIAESHISIHTFPEKQHAFVDIFSSRDFDTDAASRMLIEALGAKRHEASVHSRGMAHVPEMLADPKMALAGSHRTFH